MSPRKPSGNRKACDIRFDAGEAKRGAVEQFLLQGLTVKESLRRADMSVSMWQHNRSKYPQWRARWDRAKLVSRDLQSGLLTSEHKPGNQRGDGRTHVPATFEGFIEKFFPDRDLPQTHHLMLAQSLQSLRPREVVLFLLWPGAGKSSVIEDYICRKLAMDPDHRFRVVSSSDDHAKRMLDFCKRRMTDLEQFALFIARFGPFYEKNQERSGKPWAAEEFTVWKSSGGERDRSVKATGWRGATLGSRIDTLIWDDVQTPENYSQADVIFARLRSTYFSRGKSMRTIIIGNRCGPQDLYDRLEDAGLITRRVLIPAAGWGGAEPHEPSVPDWWQDEDLVHEKHGPCCGGLTSFRDCPDDRKQLTPQEFLDMTKHSVGPDAWHSLYQQNPLHHQLSTFGAALTQCLDHDRTIGQLVAV